MADSFREREKGYEAKFQLDQQQQFKAEMRRNRLLGEWLADQHFGLTGKTREDYATEVVFSDLEEPGIEDVIRKVMKDVADKGSGPSEDEVRAKMEEFHALAAQQISKEA